MVKELGQKTVRSRTRGPSIEKTAETRGRLIEAALAVFVEHGYANTTIADIAKRAGIAKGTPYRYFTTKEHLLEGVLEDVVVSAVSDLNRLAPSNDETVEAFLRRTVLPFMREFEKSGRAAIARLVICDGGAFPKLVEIYKIKVYEPMIDLIRRSAALARERGEISDRYLADCPHLLVAPLWVGIVHNAVLSPESHLDIGAMFELQLDLLFSSGKRTDKQR
ncbi:TetR/AcrR family transcriptional regulator [Agrobacterium sp. MCAB5]|uniref:TetR/AcrR family transcriptional regulator n=1 Tax=Agrobacterium sp. MCAB5 TaxID=3233042 RepID=UPI003F91EEF2